MGRTLLATSLAALVCFMWSAVYWVALPMTGIAHTRVDDLETHTERLSALLERELPGTGVFTLPPMVLRAEDPARYEQLRQSGPMATIFFRSGSGPASPATNYLLGYLQLYGAILIVALLLRRFGSQNTFYWTRVGFVFGIFAAAAVLVDLSAPVWWSMSWRYWLVDSGFQLSAGLLAGMVLARMITGRR